MVELTSELKNRLRKLPTGNVSDSNISGMTMESAIKPVDPKSKIIGRAVTVECQPGDNLALHQGIYAASPGDVIIFSLRGYSEAGHFGDIMATACQIRGIEGVVIDGSCRDSEDIREMGFPVFARAFNPYGTVKKSLARINVPLVCGKVMVHPGDIIFGDCDGVVVVPKKYEDEVFKKALAKYDREIEIKKLLQEGKTTLEIYGFDKIIGQK